MCGLRAHSYLNPLAASQERCVALNPVLRGRVAVSTNYMSSGWLFPGSFGMFFATVGLLVGLVLWLALARSHFIRGGGVERPERVPQLYGYSVCLVAVVVMLTSLSTLVNRAFSLSDPLLGAPPEMSWAEPSVTSFEAYRATLERAERFNPGGEARPREVVPEPELRRRYEGLRADRVTRASFTARRELTSSAVMLLVAAGLFWLHWRWVRSPERRREMAGSPGPTPSSVAAT